MSNDYYSPSGWPGTGVPGASAPGRAELISIGTGFDKLPGLTGNGSKVVRVNAGATALEAVSSLSLTDLTLTGVLKLADGTTGAPSLAFSSSLTSGLLWDNSQVTVNVAGNRIAAGGTVANGWIIRTDSPLSWGTTGSATVSPDLFLFRDAADVLAQRRTTNAQTFRLYNTFTDASNYERASFGWSANLLTITTANAGTGVARNITIQSAGAQISLFPSGAGTAFNFSQSGLLLSNNNSLDIGANGASSPRSIYWGTQAFGPNGSATNPSYSFASDPDTGMFATGTANELMLGAGNSNQMKISAAGAAIRDSSALSWGTTGGISAIDLSLFRDAAQTLAQRNGTNAQVFRVYSTFTDLSNYQRSALYSDANGTILADQAAGTGSVKRVQIETSGAVRWFWSTTGHHVAAVDNTYDIGASGATRPRSMYFGTSILGPTWDAPLGTINIQTAGSTRWQVTSAGLIAATDNTYDIGASGATRPRTMYLGTSIVLPNTGLTIFDTDSSHVLSIVPGSNITANRTLTITSGDQNRTLTFGADFTVSNSLTLAGTNATTITFQGTDTYVGRTTTDTLTNKRVTWRVSALADATSITPTDDTADENTHVNTQAGGTLTVNATGGTPTSGQRLVLRLKCTNVQTYAFNAIYRGSTDIPLPATTTGASKTDYLGFIYNTADSKWDLIALVAGFT